jgi:hypothetical protein
MDDQPLCELWRVALRPLAKKHAFPASVSVWWVSAFLCAMCGLASYPLVKKQQSSALLKMNK